jgi:outer membrane protein W
MINYNVSVPSEEMKSFVDNTSFMGMSVESRKFIRPNISVGIYFGWQVFYWKTSNVIDVDKGHISGKQYRHVNSLPLMLNAHLYLGGEECFRPYVGINAGVYYVWQRFDMGMIALEDKKWHLGGAPEAGFTLPISDAVHFNLGGKLNYALEAGDSEISKDSMNPMYLSFHLGFAYYR